MVDIDILNTDNKSKLATMTVSGHRITGIRALAQRVMITLLTRVDDELRSDEGTSLRRDGLYVTSGKDYMSLVLSSALFDVVSIIKSDTDSDDPSEQLKDALVSDVSVTDDGAVFTIDVYNNMGDVISVPSSAGV